MDKDLILNIEDLKDKQYSVTMPVGDVSTEGIIAIKELLTTNKFPIPEEDQFEWVWQTRRGTLPKRLAQFVKKETKNKMELSSKLTGDIGAEAKRNTGEGTTYYFDIVGPPFNWKDGKYGVKDSCWWGSYKDALNYLVMMNGHCARFYKENKFVESNGCGRIWLYPKEDGLITFNGYMANEGKWWTFELSRAISLALGVSYRKFKLSTNCYQKMYVNSSSGVFIGAPSIISKFIKKHLDGNGIVTIIIDMDNYRVHKCFTCHNLITNWSREENTIKNKYNDGYDVCLTCIPKIGACDNCCSFYPLESFSSVNNKKYCLTCFDDLFFSCVGCEKIIVKDYNSFRKFNTKYFCIPCTDVFLTKCKYCLTIMEKDVESSIICGICDNKNQSHPSNGKNICTRCVALARRESINDFISI